MDIAQIVSIAKTKVGSTSLSDRTFTEYFTAVNHQGEPDDAFWTQHVAVLKSMSGQFSHEIAEWQKSHPAPAPTDPQGQTPPDGLSPEVKKLLEGYQTQSAQMQKQMQQMQELLTKQQRSATEQQLRAGGIANGTTVKATKIALWNDVVGRTPITEGMTQEQFNAAVKATYEQNLQLFGEGIQGYGASSPVDTSAEMKKELDAFFASKGFGVEDNK